MSKALFASGLLGALLLGVAVSGDFTGPLPMSAGFGVQSAPQLAASPTLLASPQPTWTAAPVADELDQDPVSQVAEISAAAIKAADTAVSATQSFASTAITTVALFVSILATLVIAGGGGGGYLLFRQLSERAKEAAQHATTALTRSDEACTKLDELAAKAETLENQLADLENKLSFAHVHAQGLAQDLRHIVDATAPDWQSRLKSAWALGESSEPSDIPRLALLLGDEAPQVRQAAAYALGRRRAQEHLDALLNHAMDDRADTVRLQALESANIISPRHPAVVELAQHLYDSDGPDAIKLLAFEILRDAKQPRAPSA